MRNLSIDNVRENLKPIYLKITSMTANESPKCIVFLLVIVGYAGFLDSVLNDTLPN